MTRISRETKAPLPKLKGGINLTVLSSITIEREFEDRKGSVYPRVIFKFNNVPNAKDPELRELEHSLFVNKAYYPFNEEDKENEKRFTWFINKCLHLYEVVVPKDKLYEGITDEELNPNTYEEFLDLYEKLIIQMFDGKDKTKPFWLLTTFNGSNLDVPLYLPFAETYVEGKPYNLVWDPNKYHEVPEKVEKTTSVTNGPVPMNPASAVDLPGM